jgi:arylsulfatase A-like enzyme
MLSAVDRGVGEVLAALEDRGKLDRTVVVITSDQGVLLWGARPGTGAEARV